MQRTPTSRKSGSNAPHRPIHFGQHRIQSMLEALRKLRVPHSPGAPLFFFTTRDELRATNPLAHEWRDGNDRGVRLT